MIAIWMTLVLVVAGIAAAMTLTWRKWARVPAEVKPEGETCGCYPRMRR